MKATFNLFLAISFFTLSSFGFKKNPTTNPWVRTSFQMTPANGAFSIPGTGNVTVRMVFETGGKKAQNWDFSNLGSYVIVSQSTKKIVIDIHSYETATLQGVTGSFCVTGSVTITASDGDITDEIFSICSIPVP